MRRIFFLFTIILLWQAPGIVYSQSIPIRELIKRADYFDRQNITLQVEVIGERMCRQEGCWLNVNDGDLSIGVWVPKEINYIPKYTGGYKTKGDIIEIKGIFYRSCSQHLGELDIHAQQITIIQQGREFFLPLNVSKIKLTIIIWVGLCLILIWKKLKKN